MKRKNSLKNSRKRIIQATVAAVAGITVAVAAFRPVETSANGVLPGVESIVAQKMATEDKTYRILEIMPDGAESEMGYLAAGSEPVALAADGMLAYFAENGIENTQQERMNYINSLKQRLEDGKIASGDTFKTPLYAEAYEETFFPTEEQQKDYKKLVFPEEQYETITAEGHYAYRQDYDGNYNPNVVSFSYNATGDYAVEFERRTPLRDEAPYNQPYEYRDNGTDGYYEAVENPMTGGNYYYISDFYYVGADSEHGHYLAQLDAAKPYSYTASGDGAFAFVPGTAEEDSANQSCQVEMGSVWYTGGLYNNNLFRDYVLGALSKDDLKVEVTAVTESGLASVDVSGMDFIYIGGQGYDTGMKYQLSSPELLAQVDKIYKKILGKAPVLIDSTVLESALTDYNTSDIAKLVVWSIQKELKDDPQSVDAAELCDTASLNSNYTGNDTNYAENNVYCMKMTDADGVRQHVFTGLLEAFPQELQEAEGFAPVRALIEQENTLRTSADAIDTTLSKNMVLQYILNYPYERTFSDKEELRVLDIEPAMGALYLDENTADDRILTKKKLADWTGVAIENISITRMTSAEFIGKIEDMNMKYDLVYFGLGYAGENGNSDAKLQGDYMNRDAEGNTVYNDSLMNGLVYAHTGDAFLRKAILGGLLDTDYVDNNTSNYLYGGNPDSSRDPYGDRDEWDSGLGKLVTATKTISGFQYDNPKNRNDRQEITVTVGNVGVYRASGNDITESKKRDLEEFLGAKYPVLFAQNFVTTEGEINAKVVDNSSVLYQFAKENLAQDNVFYLDTEGKPNDESSFRYYINMPKVKLAMLNPSTGVEESDTALSTGTARTTDNNYGNKIVEIRTDKKDSGVYTLRYRFRIDSSVDASAATVYHAGLYFDMNADGKFIENDTYSERQKDCIIFDASGNEVNRDAAGEYQLSSGQEYYLEKDIPGDYRGMLTWKLELTQTTNAYIRTAKTGYTIVSRTAGDDSVQVVKVLQIMGNNNEWGGYFNLSQDRDMQDFISNFENTEGVRFEITAIPMRNFDGKYTSFEQLKDYQMLIFGFQDSYSDMTNADTLAAVDDYIVSGRSVLFTHDTSSFVNVATEQMYCQDNPDGDNGWNPGWLSNQGNAGDFNQVERHWGYMVNQKFRGVLGMDRYGITYNKRTSKDPQAAQLRSLLLKEGQLLDISTTTDASGNEITTGTIDTAHGGVTTRENPDGSGALTSAVLGSDKDIAYVPGTNQKQSYGQTQGYTYGAINFHYYYNAPWQCTTEAKYAYNQYMMWRTLPLPTQRNDVSLGNLKNNASMYATQVNDGQITHYPYEIGSQITIANTHYQYYQLNMDEDMDGDENSDIVVWYCLGASGDGSAIYTSSPNDVRNNYYIYNIGNITYSGVGHSTISNVNEKQLFFNTIVAAYKTRIKDPVVKLLENGSRTSAEKEAVYVHTDNAIGNKALENEVSFYYTVTDSNLVTSDKEISVDYSMVDKNGSNIAIPVQAAENQVYITTEAVNGDTVTTDSAGRLRGLKSGEVYKATVHNLTDTKVQEAITNGNMRIAVHAVSTFDYYGDSYGLGENAQSIPQSSTSMKILGTTLFDLD